MIRSILTAVLCTFMLLPTVSQTKNSILLPDDLYYIKTTAKQPYVLVCTRPTKGNYYKNKGTYYVVDEITGNTLWTKELDYRTSKVTITDYGVLYTKGATLSGSSTTLYDTVTGTEKLKIKLWPIFIDSDLDLLIGYKGSSKKKIECQRMSNGEKLWEAEIGHHDTEYWNNVSRIDNNHLLLLANDCCLLNLQTGETKTYDAKTMIADVKAGATMGVLNVLGAALVGAVTIPTSGNVITSLYSNILQEGNHYYFSDRTHLACLDPDMNEVWRYDFPDKTAAHARLFCNNDTLFMLNEGYGIRGAKRSMVGKPFFAAFQKATGQNINFNLLPDSIDENTFGKQLSFAPDSLYLLSQDSTYFTPIIRTGDIYNVYTSTGDVAVVNHDLQVIQTYPKVRIYAIAATYGPHTIVGQWGNKSDFWMKDDQNHIQRHLSGSFARTLCKGNKIYTAEGNKLLVSNVENFIQ